MPFTRIQFFLFFGIVLVSLALAPNNRVRKVLILGASYYFYAYWDWRFLLLLIAATFVSYLAAFGLSQTGGGSSSRRKWVVIGGIVFNLGILSFFKYCNFFCESLQGILGPLGIAFGTLDIALPLGISFYVFQMLSYLIDVYRGRLEPCRSFTDFALFAAFFPKLIAGPIVRATDFLPQLRSEVQMSWGDVFTGFRQFTIGLFKKVFIADHLATFVDYVFGNAGAFAASATWLAVLCYGVQIYCDFSGYSDMAIGTARIMGYNLPDNFKSPYLATSITDFWHRWHITLSTWLRDYLYIPLGGNRKGPWRTHLNLLITMVLGGLWHGASWTFVCWGALHGCALVGDKWSRAQPWSRGRSSSLLSRVLGWFVTMLIVFTAWAFFRAASFEHAFLMLRQMYFHPHGLAWYPPFAVCVLIAAVLVHVLIATGRVRLDQLVPHRIVTPVLLFSMWWLVLAFPPKAFSPFAYAQF